MKKRLSKASGITLIELMMVVAIVGILAAIAYPSYRAQVLRSQRTEARTALMQAVQQFERCYTRTNSYASTTAGCPALPFNTERGLYQISDGGTPPTATTYVLRATPQGGQAQDTQCGWLQIDQANRRTSETLNAVCW